MIKKIRTTGAACAKCGGRLWPHAKFCHHCGGAVFSKRLSKCIPLQRAGRANAYRKITAGVLVTIAILIGALYSIHYSSPHAQSPSVSTAQPQWPTPPSQGGNRGGSTTLPAEATPAPTPYQPPTSNTVTNVQVPQNTGDNQTATAPVLVNVADYAAEDAETAPQPILYTDGEITSVQVPSSIEGGQTATSSVTVRNTGNTDATFEIRLGTNSDTSEQIYLTAGNSETVYFDLTLARGQHHVSSSLYADGTLLDTDSTPVTVTYVDLEVAQEIKSFCWGRDENGLPICTVTLSFTVTNGGTGPARNVPLRLESGGATVFYWGNQSDNGGEARAAGSGTFFYEQAMSFYRWGKKLASSLREEATNVDTISYLGVGQSFEGSYSITLTYEDINKTELTGVGDYRRNVRLGAGDALSDCVVYAGFDISYYVTPNNPIVRNTLDEILGSKSWWDIRPDWKVIRDWVKNEITYAYDDEEEANPHSGTLIGDGVPGSQYWQLPRETIQLRAGDCEDQASLLASLLRAYGYGPEDVYVVLGNVPGGYHAWVKLKPWELLEYEHWRILEPTAGGLFSGANDLLNQLLGTYDEVEQFNDASTSTSGWAWLEEQPTWLRYEEGNLVQVSHNSEYITPQDTLVKKYSGTLPSEPTVSDLGEIRRIYEFVRQHWQPRADDEDYWAYPCDTLREYERMGRMRGDCEDVAFLTVSLFRASGVAPNNVRVVFGMMSRGGHAHAEIAIVRNGVKYWIPLEPGWGADYLEYAYTQHPMERASAWNDMQMWFNA